MNKALLDRYSECATAAEVIEAQQEYLDSLREEADAKSDGEEEGGGYLRVRDLPPSDSDEYEHTSDDDDEEEEVEIENAVQQLTLGTSSKGVENDVVEKNK